MMTIKEVKEQLFELISDRKSFLKDDLEDDQIYLQDIEALRFAINLMSKIEERPQRVELDYKAECVSLRKEIVKYENENDNLKKSLYWLSRNLIM